GRQARHHAMGRALGGHLRDALLEREARSLVFGSRGGRVLRALGKMSVVRTGKKTALAFSLVFGVALLVLVCRWSVDGSMTAMLPPASRELSQDAQRVLDSSVSRAMLLSIGPESGSDPKEARRVARELAATLASHSGVAWVELGPAPELERHVFDAYFPRR